MRYKIIILTAFINLFSAHVNLFSQLNGNCIVFQDSATAFIAGEDGMIMKTENMGENWQMLNSGVTNNMLSIAHCLYSDDMISYNVIIITAENGMILKSVNSGLNWEIKKTGTLEHLNDIFILSPDDFFVCGNNGTLLYSNDLGETWSSNFTGTNVNFTDVFFTTAGDLISGYLAGNNGTILYSSGINGFWNPAQTGTTNTLHSVCLSGSGELFACGNWGTLIKSSNMGITWSQVSSGTSEHINEVVNIPGTQRLIAACDNGVILKSTNGGSLWSALTTSTLSDLTAIGFGSSMFGIATGAQGAELFSTDGGLTWQQYRLPLRKNLAVRNKVPELHQNYPNPFNPSTVISYELPFTASVSLKVYDLAGREVAELVNTIQKAGNYDVQFNAGSLSSGVYLYVIKANDGQREISKTMKMILVK